MLFLITGASGVAHRIDTSRLVPKEVAELVSRWLRARLIQEKVLGKTRL